MTPHGEKELYDFENQILHITPWYEHEHSFDLMYALLWGIWVGEHGSLDGCPKLSKKEHPQVISNGVTTSFYDLDTHTIHLVEGHRNLIILAHEITHSMGQHKHDWRFRKLYFHLLDRYIGIKKSWLEHHYRAWTSYQRTKRK